MAERNRVTPLGDIAAFPLRGAWTGNRGILHDGHRVVRFHASDAWLTCALDFRGRWNPQWRPHHYTYLYFHDEAVALAAGHRPCAECRRADYTAYRDAWSRALSVPVPSARAINSRLHAERLHRGTHRRRLHALPWSGLPDGVFALLDDGTPALLHGDALVEWSPDGYGRRRRVPSLGAATVITPPSSVAALRAGYRAQIDASAGRS
ncbi:hypothetical protein [Streptomyces sp. NPDC087270]|uniref:hypothetical protein n=1 Tax=Streptomyces sp. NPDC087270 TaxID=3365774 RepID=UPI0038027617